MAGFDYGDILGDDNEDEQGIDRTLVEDNNQESEIHDAEFIEQHQLGGDKQPEYTQDNVSLHPVVASPNNMDTSGIVGKNANNINDLSKLKKDKKDADKNKELGEGSGFLALMALAAQSMTGGIKSAVKGFSKWNHNASIEYSTQDLTSSSSRLDKARKDMDVYWKGFSSHVKDVADQRGMQTSDVYNEISKKSFDPAIQQLQAEYTSVAQNKKARDAMNEYSNAMNAFNQRVNGIAAMKDPDGELGRAVSSSMADVAGKMQYDHPVVSSGAAESPIDSDISSSQEKLEKLQEAIQAFIERIMSVFNMG